MRNALRLLGWSAVLGLPASALKIATSLQWIEYTPQPYAIKNFYKGDTPATLQSGGVMTLASSPRSVDLAANAETQGLKQFANHKDLRLIYVIVEVGYRIVANKAAGINTLADLKGKKIGSMPGTSAGYFISKFLGSVGLKESDYTVVSGNVCMKTPCGAGTYPQMIANKQIDAFGIWEPAVELGAQALGANAVIFSNASIYREVYSLYSTESKLKDPAMRKDIVAFIKALNQASDVYNNKPETVYASVAQTVGMDPAVVEAVWKDHKWSGPTGIPKDLLDFMYEEDQWLATKDRRKPVPKDELAKFIDPSVLEEALKT
jgi:ABC-type nitrate/sulfonate/bicarbonate transport system substrate-binding protein